MALDLTGGAAWPKKAKGYRMYSDTSGTQWISRNGAFGPPGPVSETLPREMVAEPIEGWRTWRIVREADTFHTVGAAIEQIADAIDRGERNPYRALMSPLLAPVANGDMKAWLPGQRMAATICPQHEDGLGERCQCGYWALRKRSDAEETAVRYGADCFGRVQVWGKVVEHEVGYRSEYARPIELFVFDEKHLAIGDVYGVPVSLVERPAERDSLHPLWSPLSLSGVSGSSVPVFGLSQWASHNIIHPPIRKKP